MDSNLHSMKKRPVVFIDKDGTLIENVHFNVDPRKLRFMPNAGEALAVLARAGFALIVVTNQSGIALGYFSVSEFSVLQEALCRRIQDEFGVVFDDFMVCPHAPGRRDAPACSCRKPSPGMLLEAARRHDLDMSRSWIVGDTLDDAEAGIRAGCSAILFDSGGETVWHTSPIRQPHAICTDWRDVADLITTSCGANPVVPEVVAPIK